MVCIVTLGSHIVPPPAQSRVHAEFRPGYSGFCPIRSGEFPKLEILQPFYASLLQCLPHLTKTFPCVKLELSTFYSTGFWSSRCICSYLITFLPQKNSPHECCSCSLHGPCCCVFTIPKYKFLGKQLLFCQLRSGNPQVLCMGHKQTTSDSWLKFTGKLK